MGSGQIGGAGRFGGGPRERLLDSAYRDPGAWDIGRPQPEVVRLAQEGRIRGSVLVPGCGTGENALFLASRGHDVWGVDLSEAAVERSRSKARERRLHANFAAGDALRLHEVRRAFDTILDVGLFHLFDDDQRRRYVAGLKHALAPGGVLHVLVFSEREPGDGGPRRVSQQELRAAFRTGWEVRDVRPARLETRVHDDGARAWLATIERAAAAAWLRG